MDCLRVGCVPYLNGVPLAAWFHSTECDANIDLTYVVPSELARQLRDRRLDVAMVSSFESFQNPDLRFVPGISISADGPVKSVRLFSKVPFSQIRSVALDTSSLTSVALTRILLKERYGLEPDYIRHPPALQAMLAECDAGLIIGDLQLFDSPAAFVMDLGEEWKALTCLPFVYAGWLARADVPDEPMTNILTRARDWGAARLASLSEESAERMNLPLERVEDYFFNVMQYDLDAPKLAGLARFHQKCREHGLVDR